MHVPFWTASEAWLPYVEIPNVFWDFCIDDAKRLLKVSISYIAMAALLKSRAYASPVEISTTMPSLLLMFKASSNMDMYTESDGSNEDGRGTKAHPSATCMSFPGFRICSKTGLSGWEFTQASAEGTESETHQRFEISG